MQNIVFRFVLLMTVTLLGPGHVMAQSAGGTAGGTSLSAPAGGGSPSPSMMAPSTTKPTNGAPTTGTGPDGGNTPTQSKADQEMKKETTICKGC